MKQDNNLEQPHLAFRIFWMQAGSGRRYYLLCPGAKSPPTWEAPAEGKEEGPHCFIFFSYLISTAETTCTSYLLCLAFKINTLELNSPNECCSLPCKHWRSLCTHPKSKIITQSGLKIACLDYLPE